MDRRHGTSATRRLPVFKKSTRPRGLGTGLLLISLLTLTSCASPDQTLPPAAATVSPNSQPLRPLACSEFKLVVGHGGKITADGKPDVQKADVVARLALPDWEAQLRRLFGDTSDTLAAIRLNNAAWRALCQ